MNKEEIKTLVTKALDTAMVHDKPVTFKVLARKEMGMAICAEYSDAYHYPNSEEIPVPMWVDLLFNGDGLLRLVAGRYKRIDMINIFTNFIWTTWFDYQN